MLKEGIIIGDRYEIISRVGSGGMADVYKSMDHKLNRLVAVKVLKPEFREDTTFIARFRKEAQSAAGLSHSNIVNIYDVGEDRGLYYIVMELVEGITLKNYIQKKGKLSVKEATSIAIQVSLGLQTAHDQGLIHRDIKPQNIIISIDGKVKLSDFGIAKATNSNTNTTSNMGSVHYSSPEQVRGGVSDAKSDIYSLGITMYEMVTGRVPYDGETTVAIAIKHLQEKMVSPSIYTPDLPYSLEQIILKCTQKDPAKRYQNMGELIEDLKRSLMDPQGDFVRIGEDSSPVTVMAAPGEDTGRTPEVSAAARKTNIKSRSTGSLSGAASGRSSSGKSSSSRSSSSNKNRSRKNTSQSSRRRRYEDDYDDYDTYEDEDNAVSSKLEKAITAGAFIIGGVIIVILILLIANWAGLFNRNRSSADNTGNDTQVVVEGDTVVAPSFLGKTLEDAEIVAAQYGLYVKQTGTMQSDEYAEGQILSQETRPGDTVAAGSTINVVVSSGSALVTIPGGLTGSSQTDVESTLRSLGLTVTAELNASEMEIGCVIALNPAEGSQVKPGSAVHIYVSKGPDDTTNQVAVPPLAGYNQTTAQAILESYGLVCEAVTGTSDQVAEGEVISVEPAEGTMVEKGSTVTIVINGPVSNSNEEINGNSSMICYIYLEEPYEYIDGPVTFELVQGDKRTIVFEGGNPWEGGNVYENYIHGANGIAMGTLNIYDWEGDLMKSIPLTFVPEE
ncbi:MAG: Stk1 family PASTA domain-containing Ser/Thr kinase [Eubacterium sp.]|nr:Stk1 family PASTA domain-containing Ser/Thr kinase [Eubacterium sp.]